MKNEIAFQSIRKRETQTRFYAPPLGPQLYVCTTIPVNYVLHIV